MYYSLISHRQKLSIIFFFFTSSNLAEDNKDLDMKLFIGGLVHNNKNSPTKYEYVCPPTDIKNLERDSFLLHVPKRS